VRVPGPDAVEILITSSGDRDDVVHTGTGLRARRGAPHPSRWNRTTEIGVRIGLRGFTKNTAEDSRLEISSTCNVIHIVLRLCVNVTSKMTNQNC